MGAKKVRETPDLLRIYVSLFAQRHGYAPACAGCTFASHWRIFTGDEAVKFKHKNNKVMTKTYQLKSAANPIIAFVANGKRHYAYANQTSDEFMIGYLTHGSADELKSRREMFKKLPDGFKVAAVEVKETAPVKKTRQRKAK